MNLTIFFEKFSQSATPGSVFSFCGFILTMKTQAKACAYRYRKNVQMKKIILFWVMSVICLFYESVHAIESCYSSVPEVLECFLKYNDNIYRYKFEGVDNSNPAVVIKNHLLYSQKWPIDNYSDIPSTNWKHRLVLYIPKQIFHHKVLLYVNGGYNENISGAEEFVSPKGQIDYARIANDNQAVVVELQDVPNQYLFFNDKPFKEDQILAYTYKKFMDEPMLNAYLAGHLPMVKAIVKAMDAASEILKQEHDIEVTGFVLAGASKRGWAVWLAALADVRIEAIIPIVANILNTQKSISHICQTYGGVCPPALKDYEKYNFTKMIDTNNFTALMEVEDPFSYLKDSYAEKYKTRLAIPKYIINASGDDFFVPDSSRWYFKYLPGDNNYIRYLPNAMHYLKVDYVVDNLHPISEALNSYFYFILHKTSLPRINWKFTTDQLYLESSMQPKVVKLWVANNEKSRDFRFFTSYAAPKWQLIARKIFYGSMCDHCYQETDLPVNCKEVNSACQMHIPLPSFNSGWQAVFAELHYNVDSHEFVITTEVNITPDTMPPRLADAQLHEEL